MTNHRNENSTQLGSYNRNLLQKPWTWWGSLSSLASSSIVIRFNVFLVVIPFLVGLLRILPGQPFQPPLSWAFGYLAAVFFLLAILLVKMWCPDAARHDRTFDRVIDEGRTQQYIVQLAREVYLGYSEEPARANWFLFNFLTSDKYVENADKFREELNEGGALKSREVVWLLFNQAHLKTNSFDDMFWYVKWFSEATSKTKRGVCCLLFGAGITSAFVFLLAQLVGVLGFYFCQC